MSETGTCETCAAFSKIAADKKSCVVPKCSENVDGKIATTADGDCVTTSSCPSYSKLDNTAGKNQCVETDCSAAAASKNWVGMDGECYATGSCPNYTKKETTSPKRCT